MLKSFFVVISFVVFSMTFFSTYSSGIENDGEPVSVMTFNIRYDNPNDKPNDWPSRRNWVSDLVNYYHPDFVGTQEALLHQLKDMQERMPEYVYVGVGRDSGKEEGEFSAIFYKKDKYQMLRSSTFWLSETSEKPSKGWDAALNRIVTWGEFKDRSTGNTFYVFNTHFDHVGVKAREESAKLLLKKVQEIADGKNSVIMGDFNSNPTTKAYEILTNGIPNNNGFIDLFKLAQKPYGPEWTFHSFGNTPVENRSRIDYIFTNKKVNVFDYIIISEQRGQLFPSDHLPVMAKFSFE